MIMDGYEYLARCFKECENKKDSEIKIGTVTSLPHLKIKVGEKAVLDERHIISLVDLYEKDIADGILRYINLNKNVVLLRYDKKFIVLGVVHNEKNA